MAARRKINDNAYGKAIRAMIAQAEGQVAVLHAEAGQLLRNGLATFLAAPGIDDSANGAIYIKNGPEFRRLAGEVLRINSEMAEGEAFVSSLRVRLEKAAEEAQTSGEPATAEAVPA